MQWKEYNHLERWEFDIFEEFIRKYWNTPRNLKGETPEEMEEKSFRTPKLSVKNQLLLTTRYLKGNIKLIDLGRRFGVSKSNARNIKNHGVMILLKHWAPIALQKPTFNPEDVTELHFFPGQSWIVDGIQIGQRHKGSYKSDWAFKLRRDGVLYVLLMHRISLLFYNIWGGVGAGSTNDLGLLQHSSLYKDEGNYFKISQNPLALGDLGFQDRDLFVYPRHAESSIHDEEYNRNLRSARSSIERRFGVLKSMFRILKYTINCDARHHDSIFRVCASLYNLKVGWSNFAHML